MITLTLSTENGSSPHKSDLVLKPKNKISEFGIENEVAREIPIHPLTTIITSSRLNKLIRHFMKFGRYVEKTKLKLESIDLNFKVPNDIKSLNDAIGVDGGHKERMILSGKTEHDIHCLYQLVDDSQFEGIQNLGLITQIFSSRNFYFCCVQTNNSEAILRVADKQLRHLKSYDLPLHPKILGKQKTLLHGLQLQESKVYFLKKELYRSQLHSIDVSILSVQNLSSPFELKQIKSFFIAPTNKGFIFDEMHGLASICLFRKVMLAQRKLKAFKEPLLNLTFMRHLLFGLTYSEGYCIAKCIEVYEEKNLALLQTSSIPYNFEVSLCKTSEIRELQMQLLLVYMPDLLIYNIWKDDGKLTLSLIFSKSSSVFSHIKQINQIYVQEDSFTLLCEPKHQSSGMCVQKFKLRLID